MFGRIATGTCVLGLVLACGTGYAAATTAPAPASGSPRTVYVADAPPGAASGKVVPVDAATHTAGQPVKVGPSPISIAITPDGSTAYVAHQGGTVTPIATATDTAGQPIAIGHSADDIAITPDGATAYVSDSANGTVRPITVAIGDNPSSLAITP